MNWNAMIDRPISVIRNLKTMNDDCGVSLVGWSGSWSEEKKQTAVGVAFQMDALVRSRNKQSTFSPYTRHLFQSIVCVYNCLLFAHYLM
jgi:hypothetical protein